MRKLVSVLICFAFFGILSAQNNKNMFSRNAMNNLENFDKQRIHWGYFLGFNFLDFKMDHIENTEPVLVRSTTGFNVGLIGNLRLTEHLDIRFEPGLFYTQRNLEFPGFTTTVDQLREVKSTYIMFPLLLKFSSKRVGNIKPYLIGGFSYALNLSSNSKSLDDNSIGRFRMERLTPNYELGFGIDLYFEYFKFSPSIRGVFGINDEIIRDNDPNSPWTGNIHAMRTRGVFLNFAFH